MVGKVSGLSCVSPERLSMKYVAEDGKIVEEKTVEENLRRRKGNILLIKCSSLSPCFSTSSFLGLLSWEKRYPTTKLYKSLGDERKCQSMNER